MVDINKLRSMRGTDFSKMSQEFEKESNPNNSFVDERFWKLERDQAGNGSATIRFLPRVDGDDLAWVKVWSHGFKGPSGRWYIENSLTTIGLPDPVGELNQKLWNMNNDDKSPERKQARDQKRKLNFISNILVINDPKHPENNGKVFLFKYGKKIFDKIMDKARPIFEDEDPINVFDFWEGAAFKLRLKIVDKFPNYDSSEFEKPSQIADSDEEIIKIASGQYKLSEFTDPSNFKSYDQLKAKLQEVLTGAGQPTAQHTVIETQSMPVKTKPAPEPAKSTSPTQPKTISSDDDDDEELAMFFKNLANSED